MKISVGLIILSLGLAFVAGYVALQVRHSEGHQFSFSVSEMSELKKKFREKTRAIDELNTESQFSPQAGFELLDPRYVYSPARGQDFSTTSSILRADKLCQPKLITKSSFSKMKIWIQFRCRQITHLPPRFFEEPPYMSPLGGSFAYLAFNSDAEMFRSPDWIQKNLQYFHALELSSVTSSVELDSKRKILSLIEANTLLMMSAGQSWILNESYLLVRRSTDSMSELQKSRPIADYLIYQRKAWDNFLSHYEIETHGQGSSACLYHDDGLCWTKSPVSETKLKRNLGLVFVIALATMALCVIQLLRNIKNQRREEERKKFALQALTHELRAPLASLTISTEQIIDQFDSLPGGLKEPCLRIADDVQRLHRLAEQSRNYLKANESNSLIAFNFSEVASLNAFVSSTLDRYGEEISVCYLSQDCSFVLDPYWVGICLQNLVENAKQHGKKPIVVDVRKENESLLISVSDSGDASALDLKKILQPFFKNSRSAGLGLGLTLVQTIVTAMNSKLHISKNPTCFQLRIGANK